MALPNDISPASIQKQSDAVPSLPGFVRYRIGALRLRFTSLWPEIKQFSRWVESSIGDLAQQGQESILLEIPAELGTDSREAGPGRREFKAEKWPELAKFLRSLGISRLKLDSRLESKQLADILTLLFTYRRGLQSSGPPSGHGFPALLRAGQAISFACTKTQINEQTLQVAYGYCATSFSRVVSWFEQREKDFCDHRALFRAAPKYALLLSLMVLSLFLVYTLAEGFWFHLAVAVVGALALFVLTYLLFMTIGSVEYDNEEKAYRLKRTYARLRLHANRIQSDLVRARAAAEESDRLKTEFLANISHEIRTPMNGILGFSELLAGEQLSHEQHEQVNTIRHCGENLLGIIDDILDLSRIEAGELTLENIEFSPADLLADVESLIKPKALEKGLQLQMSCPDSIPRMIRGDPTRLRQILLNLAGNAVKFTEHGEVYVLVSGVKRGGQAYLQFEVKDTGVGITSEKQKVIFEAFRQADGSSTRTHGGTGLGLTICQRLARALRGNLSLSSEPGKGSSFSLTIPVQVVEDEQEQSSGQRSEGVPGGGGRVEKELPAVGSR